MTIARVGQGAGDMIASIPYLKAMCAELVYLTTNHSNVPNWHTINNGAADLLVPLFESQGLKAKAVRHNECPYTHINLDARYELGWDGSKGNILTWNSLFYGIYPDMTKPWLNVEAEQKDYIVIANTARYENKNIDLTFLNLIKKEKVFIGIPGEYDYLLKKYPNIKDIRYQPVKDFLEAAQVIKSSKLFISNQTSHAVIAEGLGINRILLICPDFPSVSPMTPNGRPVIYQRYFEDCIEEIIK